MNRLPRGVFLNWRRDPDGVYRAELRFNVAGGTGFRVSGTSEGSSVGGLWSALKRVTHLAKEVITSPIAQSLLPAGTVAALHVVDTLTKAAEKGLLGQKVNGKELWKHFADPKVRSLAEQLHKAFRGKAQQTLGGKPMCLVDDRVSTPMMGAQAPFNMSGTSYYPWKH